MTRPAIFYLVLTFCAATAIPSFAQAGFGVLASFDGMNGANPMGNLIQGSDGTFYGTTPGGGAAAPAGVGGCGTVFKVNAEGELSTLHSFGGADGIEPAIGVIQALDGNLYGTTSSGGVNGYGTFFEVTPAGEFSTLYSFDSAGAAPFAPLIQGRDGNFYGTSKSGGSSTACGGGPCGSVFEITADSDPIILHSFDLADGAYPLAGLIQGTDGNFYGTTTGGGSSAICVGGCGTIFRISSSGDFSTLHNFHLADGADPNAPLVQAANGDLYGRTLSGGTVNSNCGPYQGCGTIFKMSLTGKLTTLYSFAGTDGQSNGNYYATGGVIEASDGNFYGTTEYSGGGKDCSGGCGTVFRITPSGTLTVVHSFSENIDAYPLDGLIQGTDGKLYGTTWVGGGYRVTCEIGCGTIFRLSLDLNPEGEISPVPGDFSQVN